MDVLSHSTDASQRSQLRGRVRSEWKEDLNLQVEGWLIKSGGEDKSSWKRRYFVYSRVNHTLAYYKAPPPKAAGFVDINTSASIDIKEKDGSVRCVNEDASNTARKQLHESTAKTLVTLPSSVDVSNCYAYAASTDRCYVMLAASQAERDEWLQTIAKAVDYIAEKATSWENGKRGSNSQTNTQTTKEKGESEDAVDLPPPPPSSSGETEATDDDDDESFNPGIPPMPPPPPPVEFDDDDDDFFPPPPNANGGDATGAAQNGTAAKGAAAAPAADSDSDSDSDAEHVANANHNNEEADWFDLPGSSAKSKGVSTCHVNIAAVAKYIKSANEKEEDDDSDDESDAARNGAVAPTVSTSSPVPPSIQPLLTCQRAFTQSLHTFSHSYLLRFRKHTQLNLQPTWFENEDELRSVSIFDALEKVRRLHRRILEKLERCASVEDLVSALRPLIPLLAQAHVSFTSSLPSLEKFTALVSQRPALKAFLELTDACEATSINKIVDSARNHVQSQLVPIFEAIHAQHSADGLKDMLTELRSVEQLVKATMTVMDLHLAMNLSSSAPLVAPGRFLVRSGMLKELKGASIYLVLFNDALLQVCRSSEKREKLEARPLLSLSNLTLDDMDVSDDGDRRNAFKIGSSVMLASSVDEKRAWMDDIKQMVELQRK